MSPLTVAIRANGGDVIGLGHIRRCLSLAQALSRQGALVSFITFANAATLDLISECGFNAIAVDSERDLEETRKAIRSLAASVLVVDSYDIDADYLACIREQVSLLVAVDDLANRPLPVDIVINGAAYAGELEYKVPPGALLLVGAQYVILRKEFGREPGRKMNNLVERILITVGGSDPRGLTGRLVGWIRRESNDIDLDVVIGPFFKEATSSSELTESEPGKIHLHHNPTDMRSLMLEADLAITGGGQTTYELAATGTPAVAIATAENQLQNLNSLAQAGSLVNAGGLDDPELETQFLNQLRKLIDEPKTRQQMSRRGRELVDGLGAERLAEVIIREGALRAGAPAAAELGQC